MSSHQGVYLMKVEQGPDAGRILPITTTQVVGRQGSFELTDPGISRRHAQLDLTDRGLVVTSLGAAGTTIDGVPLAEVQTHGAHLPAGAVLGLGAHTVARVLFVVRADTAPAATIVVARHRGGSVVRAELVDEIPVGRDVGLGLVLPSSSVSRRHALLRRRGDAITVEDLGSSNGTMVDGAPARPGVETELHDSARIGDFEIDVVIGASRATTSREITIRTADGHEHAVRIDADPDATTGDVAVAVSEALTHAERPLLWRAHDGLLPQPSVVWADIEVRRGERWVLDVDWLCGADSVFDKLGDRVALVERTIDRTYDVPVNRPPRTSLPPIGREVAPPPIPNEQGWLAQGGLWQIIGGIGGALAMLTVALLVGRGYLAFAIAAVCAAVVGLAATIGGARARRRHKLRLFQGHLDQLDAQLATATAGVQAAANASWPHVQETADWLARTDERIWERRPLQPDWLHLRLGTGPMPSPITVRELDQWQDAERLASLRSVVARHSIIGQHPVCLPLGPGAVNAVRSNQSRSASSAHTDPVAALGRSLVVQAATLHDPQSLAIAVVAVDPSWSWASWLPHVRTGAHGTLTSTSPSEAGALIRTVRDLVDRTEARRDAGAQLLVVLAPGALALPGAEELCDSLTGTGATALVLCGSDGRLPRDPSTLVSLDGSTVTLSHSSLGDSPLVATCESLLLDETVRAARRLAPMVDVSRQRPGGADRSTLQRAMAGETVDLTATWQQPGLRQVSIGEADDGTELMVDLRAHGPHSVLSGTTGAGKSELIKTLVISLALEHHPDQLNLFLIDFKGGSTFYDLDGLPHVVGVVTDLEHDRSLAERAFVSLDAEIVRRKALLERARCVDIIELERSGGPERMPNLVVIIDEFALLKEQFPDLVPRLDTIAKQGRSLGVHLVLGTQDPRRVVSSDIRSNTNLWLSLRVVLREQSQEILGTADAANIPKEASGRGYVRYGAADGVRGFQTSWVTRPIQLAQGREVRLRRLDGRPLVGDVRIEGTTTVLRSLVDLVRAHADELVLPPVPSLWLPPLPASLDGEAIRGRTGNVERWLPEGRLGWVAGIYDDPTTQRQGPLVIDLETCAHVVAVGVFGSGKTTFLTSAVLGLTERFTPDLLHVYGIDGGNGELARGLRGVPHVAAVIGIDDLERVIRMARRLRCEVQRRRREAEEGGAWRPMPGSPHVVVLLDEFAAVRELAERNSDPELFETLGLLMQAGPGVGVHVIATATQPSEMRQTTAAQFGGRLLMRLADPLDYRAQGTPALASDAPAGRGFWNAGAPVLVQIAQRTGTATESRDAARRVDPRHLPLPIAAMPRQVSISDLLARTAEPRGLLIGVGGDEIEPVWFDPADGRPHLLVLGEARSGRTTTLETIVRSCRFVDPSRRVLWLGSGPATLHSTEVTIDPDSATLTGLQGPALLVIDGAERLVDHAVTSAVHQIARDGLGRDVWIVVSGRPADVLRSYDDWLRYLVSMQAAVLLNPVADTEVAFALRPAKQRPPTLPGRGLLTVAGDAIAVQVATTGEV